VIKAGGGKAKLLPELLARMPPRFGRYFEPFAGGAALFFRVAPERAVLNDANAELIATYRAIAHDVERVIRELERHSARHSEARYLEVRAAWNAKAGDAAERAAMYVYLNKTCFNGLWRVNRSGANNVGSGKYARFDPDAENLRAAAAMLARAELRAGDYQAALYDARAGDFMYLDSPYDGTFTAYTTGGFTAAHQAELAFVARTLAAPGVAVMASNADTPRVRALYAGMRIDVVQCARAINRDGEGRGAVDEVIVTAGYEPGGAW
jgi:DNA adenine methylase